MTVDDRISIAHNGETYKFQILECKPETAIGIIETDLALEFVQAKDYKVGRTYTIYREKRK